MLLVWLWLGSPRDPQGFVGLFCFADREIAAGAIAFSGGGLI
jgi:hypothetical protein